jgi:hypothetical protein
LTPLRSSGLVAHLKNDEKPLNVFARKVFVLISRFSSSNKKIYFINKFQESFLWRFLVEFSSQQQIEGTK